MRGVFKAGDLDVRLQTAILDTSSILFSNHTQSPPC